jgi:hypothetical protein
MAYLKVLSQHSPGGTEEPPPQGSVCPGRDWNRVPPECNSEALPPKPTCSEVPLLLGTVPVSLLNGRVGL